MRQLARWILSAAILVAAVGSAQAQRPGGGGGFPGGGGGMGMGANQNLKSVLLSNKALQEELKIGEDQVAKFKEFADKQSEAMKGFAQFGGDEEEQIARMEAQLKLMKERLAFVKSTLTADQQKRLGQIEKQQLGFANAKIAKELGVTADQTEKIKTINADMTKEMREMFSGGFDADAQKKVANLRSETQEKIEKVLTDDQRKKWKEMTGEAFDMAKLRPMRMGN